jgi:carbon monoxide dehydrogenase subunit G
MTDSVVIGAPIGVVWSLITDPGRIPELDPRLALLSTSGDESSVGSGYVLRATRGSRSLDMTYRVVEADAPHSLLMKVAISGAESGTQAAHLQSEGNATRLTWTTETVAPFGTALLARRMMRAEMRSWLESIASLSSRGEAGL